MEAEANGVKRKMKKKKDSVGSQQNDLEIHTGNSPKSRSSKSSDKTPNEFASPAASATEPPKKKFSMPTRFFEDDLKPTLNKKRPVICGTCAAEGHCSRDC